MSGQIEAHGQKVVEMFGACAQAPDDLTVAAAADEALAALEKLLLAEDGGSA
jgi:hypothetical protein